MKPGSPARACSSTIPPGQPRPRKLGNLVKSLPAASSLVLLMRHISRLLKVEKQKRIASRYDQGNKGKLRLLLRNMLIACASTWLTATIGLFRERDKPLANIRPTSNGTDEPGTVGASQTVYVIERKHAPQRARAHITSIRSTCLREANPGPPRRTGSGA
jgi:hypothetical protein